VAALVVAEPEAAEPEQEPEAAARGEALVVAPPAVRRVRAGRAVSAIWAANGAATGGWDTERYDGTGTQQERARAYSLGAIYFNRDRYSTAADGLTPRPGNCRWTSVADPRGWDDSRRPTDARPVRSV
jgi:hypothetical protein